MTTKEKKKDNRSKITIRYVFDEKGNINFVDPCTDNMPVSVFMSIIKSLNEIQEKYNKQLKK